MINFNNSDTIVMNDTNPEVYAYDEYGNEMSQDEFAEARNPNCKIYNRIIACHIIGL